MNSKRASSSKDGRRSITIIHEDDYLRGFILLPFVRRRSSDLGFPARKHGPRLKFPDMVLR